MRFSRQTAGVAGFALLLTTVSAAATGANPMRVFGPPAQQRVVPGRQAPHARGARRRDTVPTCTNPGSDTFSGTSGNYVCDNGDVDAGGSENGIGNSGNATDSFIGAGRFNGVTGSTSGIGAGGSNSVSGNLSFVVAGNGNTISADRSIVGAGENNRMSEGDSMIGAGFNNYVVAEGSFIGAGGDGFYVAQNSMATGSNNIADGLDAFIGAGDLNEVTGSGSFIGAGGYAYATGASAPMATGNTVSGMDSFLGAGDQNTVAANDAFIGAGVLNKLTSDANDSVLAGGYGNTMGGQKASLGGGESNDVAGSFATIPGGYRNEALGNESFAAGSQAEARYTGSFVWSDYVSTEKPVADSHAGEFVARASGGVYFFSNAASSTGVHLAAGSGAWSSLSDRNAKTDIVPLDDASILAKVAALPVSAWRYKTEAGVRHVGPMAQDFYKAFGVGEDDRHITTIDEDGVALAAIKALHRANGHLQSRVANLEAQNASLERRLDALARDVHDHEASSQR